MSGGLAQTFLAACTRSTVYRFVLVGTVGFIVDAAVLTLIVHYVQSSPWDARIVSFATAVSATWLLNRRFTFDGRGPRRTFVEALGYCAIQTGGALINLAIFALLFGWFPGEPLVVPLAIGAIGGFAFNFLLMTYLLYAKRRDRTDGAH